MKAGRLILTGWLILGGAGAAGADITATFGAADSQRRIVIEVADSGAVRVGSNPDGYMLLLPGGSYDVAAGPGGPLVRETAALAFQVGEEVRTGRITISRSGGAAPRRVVYAPGERIVIAGYAGQRYVARDGGDLVLTDAPQLKALGPALAAYLRAAEAMSPEGLSSPDNRADLLAGHGVLSFWRQNLLSVSFAPIDPARFALPARPVTLAEVKAESGGEAAAVTGRGLAGSSIVRAVFRGGRLVTLDDRGDMASWAEGQGASEPVKAPGKVRDMCRSAGGLVVATQDSPRGETRIWSEKDSGWTMRLAVPGGAEGGFRALDCTGAEPLVLTTDAIRPIDGGGAIAIAPDRAMRAGFVTTLQHGGYLYVGVNAGEFGGGLRRFALTGGGAEALDGSDPKVLCGGLLNAACGPVTGLAVDPADPGCVLAATGLRHMMSSGSIVRICGKRLSLAYAKPYTLEPGWTFDPAARPTFASVAFQSLGGGAGQAWAVGEDGVYAFGKAPLPVFTAFARGARSGAGGIDWSNPGFVLVATAMNQRHSLSGGSLILVPR